MRKNKITISDIADAAGVSKATVSYILNKRQSGCKISVETSLRVLEICKKLHYKRDEVAVLLANCRKNPVQILVLSPWLYSQFSDFMVQVNKVLQRKKDEEKLEVTYGSYSESGLDKVLRSSVIKKYDAIMLLGTSENDDKWLRRNISKLSKVVLINRYIPGISSAYGNDTTAIRSLLDLVDIDHYRSIAAFISSRKTYAESCRNTGFFNGIADAGKEVVPFTDAYECAWEKVSEIMQKKQGPVLVFIPRYVQAARLLKSALSAGVRVPDDLGIITYDNHSLLNEFITPPLTTVNPQLEAIADAGVAIACAKRSGEAVENIIIPAELIPGSTAGLRQKKTRR